MHNNMPSVLLLQVWVNNSQLPGDHVVAGSFETAARVGGCVYIHVWVHGIVISVELLVNKAVICGMVLHVHHVHVLDSAWGLLWLYFK